MSSYRVVGSNPIAGSEQIEGRPNPYPVNQSQTKSFWNKTTLKVSAFSIFISTALGIFFAIEAGLVFLTVSLTAYVITHYMKGKEEDNLELEVEYYKEKKSERKSNSHIDFINQSTDAHFPGRKRREMDDDTGIFLGDILHQIGFEQKDRVKILRKYEDSFKDSSSEESYKKKKQKIEEFIKYIRLEFKSIPLDDARKNMLIGNISNKLYKPLLQSILSHLKIEKERANQLIDIALAQYVQTSIVKENIVDLFLNGEYVIEKLPQPILGNRYRIYNIYEIFITFLLPNNHPEFRLPVEDTACNAISDETVAKGLNFLRIKDKNVWKKILKDEYSRDRTGEEKIEEFCKHLSGSKLKKAIAYHNRIRFLYKKNKPENKSASYQSQQPGLDPSLVNSPSPASFDSPQVSTEGEGLELELFSNEGQSTPKAPSYGSDEYVLERISPLISGNSTEDDSEGENGSV